MNKNFKLVSIKEAKEKYNYKYPTSMGLGLRLKLEEIEVGVMIALRNFRFNGHSIKEGEIGGIIGSNIKLSNTCWANRNSVIVGEGEISLSYIKDSVVKDSSIYKFSSIDCSEIFGSTLSKVTTYKCKVNKCPLTRSQLSNSNLNKVRGLRSTIYDSVIEDSSLCNSYVKHGNLNDFSADYSTINAISGDNSILKHSYLKCEYSINNTIDNCKICNSYVHSNAILQAVRIDETFISLGFNSPDLSFSNVDLNRERLTNFKEDLCKIIKYTFKTLPVNNKIILFKRANYKPDGTICSTYDRDFKYKVGEIAEEPSYDPNILSSCSSGLHVSTLNYWEDGNLLLACEVDLDDIVTVIEGKIRCKKLKVLRAVKAF